MVKMELPIVQNLRLFASAPAMVPFAKQWMEKGAEVIETYHADNARLRAEVERLKEALTDVKTRSEQLAETEEYERRHGVAVEIPHICDLALGVYDDTGDGPISDDEIPF